MKRKNIWIILSALGLNLLFFMILVLMNMVPETKDVQDKLNAIEVWQVQPKESKMSNRKESKERPVERIKRKKLKLKTVSLHREKMKPRRILNINMQPSLDISDADMVFQANYFSEASPKDRQTLALDEVDKPPWKVNHVQPAYPYQARIKRIEGNVTLQFLVDERGHVSDVQVLNVNGFNGFGASARKAVLKWRFKPATYFGKPVAVWCTQKISFNLKGL
jgi:protein TonB